MKSGFASIRSDFIVTKSDFITGKVPDNLNEVRLCWNCDRANCSPLGKEQSKEYKRASLMPFFLLVATLE